MLYRVDPTWRTLPGAEPKFALLALRGVHLGWQGFAFPLAEARNLGGWLIRYVRGQQRFENISEKVAALPPEASSISGPEFLITSHGGAYYYGQGARAVGPDPFEQVEHDSDRAVAIVAASIVERCLEFAIESQLPVDQTPLFNPEETILADKIKMAKKLGLLSKDAVKELKIIMNVRNKFAHELHVDSFHERKIVSACSKFSLVDQIVGPIPCWEEVPFAPTSRDSEGVANHEDKLRSARFRYSKTAQILSFKLGMASRVSSSIKPFV